MDKPLIKGSLFLLNITGFHPFKQNLFSKIRAALIIVLYVIITTEFLLSLAIGGEEVNYFFNILAVVGAHQINIKLLSSALAPKRLRKLLILMEKFWVLDKCSKHLQDEVQETCRLAKKCAMIMSTTFTSIILIYLIQPIVFNTRMLPLDTYHPRDRSSSPAYELEYSLQVFNMLYGTAFILGYDFLFVAIIVHLINEMRVIQERIRNIPIHAKTKGDENTSLEEIYCLIDHHNLVIQCIKITNNIYSMVLVNQFFTSLIIICFNLICVSKDGFPPDLAHIINYGGLLIPFSGQLFAYCYAGAKLTEEGGKVSVAAFESKWWVKSQPKVRRAIALVIQRGNKLEILSAGGMIPLNLDSFRIVIKNSLSFFTLLQAVYQRSYQKSK